MHGIIHAELKKYVETNHGADAWMSILKEANLTSKTYVVMGNYPDEEAHAIVNAASSLTKVPADDILEDFGKFITPDLLGMYKKLIKPEWKTMDLLLNTEETIHKVVRLKKPGAEPPRLQFEKTGENTLKFTYTSARKMSAVAKGIIKGVADHYGEKVSINAQAETAKGIVMDIRVS